MIRILIADDHAIVRSGLKQLLSGESDSSSRARRPMAWKHSSSYASSYSMWC